MQMFFFDFGFQTRSAVNAAAFAVVS